MKCLFDLLGSSVVRFILKSLISFLFFLNKSGKNDTIFF